MTSPPTQPFAEYAGKALGHELAALIYSALIRRQVTLGELNLLLGWQTPRLSEILLGTGDTTLHEIADIFVHLQYGVHFTLSGLIIEPLNRDPVNEDEST